VSAALSATARGPAHPIVEESPVWIPMPDGARLAGRIWRPERAGAERPVPALLEFLPYRTRDLTALRDEGLHDAFAQAGYASARIDLRGTGDSEGLITDEYTAQELADGVEVIRWLAEQPWCTGRVGMFGNSWGGFNALQVAALRPPALAAIITSCSTDDRFADDMHYMGGALLTDMLDWGASFLCWMALPPDPGITGAGWRDRWLERIELAATRPAVVEWLRHQTRDGYWRHGSVIEDYGAICCPVLAVGGWQDGYSNAIPRLLAGLRVPSQGVVGPWAHGYPHAARPGPGIDFLALATRWWDHWLRDLDTGMLDEPRYRSFMQEQVPPDPSLDTTPGRWVAEAFWPSPRIRPTRWTLSADGRLVEVDAQPGTVEVATELTVGLTGGEWCPYGTGGAGPELAGEQVADDARSVAFDSEPLAERMEILGAFRVSLALRDGYRGVAVARLCDVWPDGRSTRVSFAVVRGTFDPGELTLTLNDTAYAFLPGHRIRVALSTSYWPMVWPEGEGDVLRFEVADSTLELPLRPTDPADGQLASLGSPWRPPAEADRRSDPTYARTIDSTPEGATTVTNQVDSGTVRVRSTGVTFRTASRDVATIQERNPLSARMEAERSVVLEFPSGESVSVTGNLVLTAGPNTYHLAGRLQASEGNRTVADRPISYRLQRVD
jgi:putative CocE/NonD family hydrolase